MVSLIDDEDVALEDLALCVRFVKSYGVMKTLLPYLH